MKIKNIIIVLLTITTITSTSIAVYFGLNQNKDEEQTQNVQIQDEENEEEVIPDARVQDENKEEEYKRIFKLADEINVINKDFTEESGLYYVTERDSASASGIYATLDDNNTVRIVFGSANMSFPNYEKYSNTANVEIDFGDRKVQNVYNMGAGQSSLSNFIFFLMEDGTVEYMPLAYAMKNDDFRSYGKIEGVENIIDMVPAYIAGGQGAGSGYTVLLIQEDGTAYDIGDQLHDIYYNQYSIW